RRQTARSRTVGERWIRGGRAGDGRWTRFSLTSAICCVVHCPSPQDIGGTPHAVRDPSRQGRHVDRARPARPSGTLPAPQGRRGDRDAGGNVLAGRGLDCRGRGPIRRSQAAVREVAEAFYDMMVDGYFIPNSPTLMNAGKGNGLQYSACYVLPVGDSMEEIFDSVKAAAIIHKSGG